MVLLSDAAGDPKPLILVCGKFGSGKSSAARVIHGHLPSYDRLDIDETRQRMGIITYRREDSPRVLNRICSDVERDLGAGIGVIVDRPHQTFGSRLLSYEAGLRHGNPLVLIETACPEEVARARIALRPSSSSVHLPSNDPAVYERIKRRWEEVPSDFDKDPSLLQVVSYVRFDTQLSKAMAVNVLPAQAIFIEEMCRILESESG